MAKRFEGIYPPTITSFTDNGDIYEEGIRHVIRYLMSEGVHGFFINGSYASFALMTSDERKRVAAIIDSPSSPMSETHPPGRRSSLPNTPKVSVHRRWRLSCLFTIPGRTPTTRGR
jgi:hypothetical protein